MKDTITADEFLYQRNPYPLSDTARKTVNMSMIDFANYHVKKALEEQAEKAKTKTNDESTSIIVDKESITNYDYSQIK